MKAKIAVAGAGIYGTSVAIRLAEQGHEVRLFDPLGMMRAASGINQYRVHAGYHYPRSPMTIAEVLEARGEFLEVFAEAIVKNSRHYYAIPREGSQTAPELFETVMQRFRLPLRSCRPDWMNFEFIDRCYEVEEQLYEPDLLRELVARRIQSLGIRFSQDAFTRSQRDEYDFVISACYGMGLSRGLFRAAKYQVAEKILVELPRELRGVALVVIDGPFTAFDPYGSSPWSLFGSAKNTNHWSTTDPDEPVPERYRALLDRATFEPVSFSRFDAMRSDSALAVPLSQHAKYLGSRFTMRVVENNPVEDRRTLYLEEPSPRELHIFSGKVVSAVKAARLVAERVARDA